MLGIKYYCKDHLNTPISHASLYNIQRKAYLQKYCHKIKFFITCYLLHESYKLT